MKKKILVALMVIVLSILAFGVVSVSASEIIASGECGENITYSLDDEGNMIISGYGAMYDWEKGSDVVWYDNMSSIKSVTVSAGITKIGDRAFLRASGLSSVSLPEGLTTIGISAFYECTSVTSISIPDSITTISDKAFQGCSGLTSITIPNKVKSIGNSAFYDCNSLTEVTIPDSITSIGEYAFTNCANITSLTIGSGVKSIGKYAFGNCYSLTGIYYNAKKVTNFGPYVFYCAGRDGIGIDIVFGENVEIIPSIVGALLESEKDKTPKITNITIENGATSIEKYAFNSCKNLTNVRIPDSVITIGSSAFSGCTALESVSFGNNVTNIRDWAFSSCVALKSVSFGNNVTIIGSYAFNNCKNLTDVRIPDSVITIGSSAFSGCTALESVSFGNNVTSIGKSAFSSCNSLKDIYISDLKAYMNIDFGDSGSVPTYYTGNLYLNGELLADDVVIPDGTTNIPMCMFYKNTNINSITIPESVTSIGANAFSSCASLKDVYISDLKAYMNINFANYASVPTYYAGNLYLNNELLTEVVIPDEIVKIPDYLFYKNNSITSIIIPDSVTNIGSHAFSQCSNLSLVKIGNGVKSIGDYAFDRCFGLDIIEIPEGVLNIGEAAFWNCSAKTITIPESVTFIGENAFYSNSLQSILYSGTEKQWNEIDLCDTNWQSKTIYYNAIGMKEIDDLTYIVSEGQAILVSANNSISGDVVIPDTVDGVPVTQILENAFYQCTGITNITIPDSVTSIGYQAFSGCNNLISVTVGKGITKIDNYAFNNCSNLESLYITDIISYLNCEYGDYYSNPMSMSDKMYIDGKRVTKLDIPDGVTQIPKSAFSNCDSLTSVTIPDSVTKIETSAFYGCDSLQEVNIGKNVTEINNSAFMSCKSLTNINFPNSLKIIGMRAFSDCIALENAILSNNITEIGERAFSDCVKLKNVQLPAKLSSIGYYAFHNCAVTDIIIPAGVIAIDEGAFHWCSKLMSVSFENDVSKIGESMFGGCYSLSNVWLPDTLQIIDKNAFYDCTSLTELTIPRTVTEIEQGAFNNCSNLSTIYYNGDLDNWSEIYVGSNNTPLNNAEKKFFWYVTIIDENGEQLSKKMHDIDGLIDISDIEEKFEHTIHLYTDAEYKNEYDLTTPISENLTLYLHYVPNQYLSKFVDYDGELIWEGLIDYGTVIIPPENPERERTQQYTYTFAGWEGFADGLTQTNREMIFTATYEATVNQYTYKFLDNDDTILKELKVDYGTVIEVPENPADKDPYTFDYWEGYQDGMELTDDISFKAVYKYKTYYVTVDGLDKVYDIVYNDAFSLETQVPEEEYLFMGYYTEENGKGTRVTDENGVCIVNYNFLTDITVYPYFPHELLNKIKINGEDSTIVGNSDVVKKVYFATDKVASYLLCTIKYPESITLKEIIEKDFVYVSEESKTVADGYVYQNLICQYTDNLDNLPYNKKVAPFELVFDIPTSTTPQNASIEITADSMLFGEGDYPFDYIINGNLEIAAKPVEGIEISGQDEVVLEDGEVTYTAIITPDWATNTEVEWTVSDETIATISKDGVLTPASAGTVTITATAKDGSEVSAEKVITIKEFAKIKTLLSDIGQWDKEFDSNIREYTIYVPYDADSISFKPTFTSGRLTINNSLAVNNRYTSIKITEDSNVIFVRTNASGYANSEYKITIVRFEGTKTTVSEDGNSFAINPINIETGKTVILSLYEDGKFVETQTATYEGETLTFITDKAYTNAKVMVWDSLTNLKPVCEVETIE